MTTTPAASSAEPAYPIASVDSALRLLLMIAERRRLRISEASRELQVARSTAHRLMQMLQFHGFAQQDPDTKIYSAGPVLVNLGLQVVRHLDERAVARPHLEQLAEELNETVHLLAFRGVELSCLDSIESARVLRAGARIGHTLRTLASATGRAILSTLPPETVRELYPSERDLELDEGHVSSYVELEDELQRIRETGYAVQHGLSEGGISGIGAAVPDPRGPSRLGITVAIPTTRLEEDRIPSIGEAVIRCSAAIGAAQA